MTELGGPIAPFRQLDAAIDAALSILREDSRPLGLLFSGGLDSSILAWELRERPGLRLSTVGVPGSPDLAAAADAARLLQLPWTGHTVHPTDVAVTVDRIGTLTDGFEGVRGSVLVSFAVAVAAADDERLVCGQGADELFLGYAHFRGTSAEAAGQRAEEDLERLLNQDWPRTQEVAERLGRSVVAPFLDPRFVAAARAVPLLDRLPAPEAKAFLRRWALHRGVPEPLTAGPKRALQYGSGIDRLLRRRAKTNASRG